MEPVLDAKYYEMLHELQSVDFVLVELNLYLDTHPGDRGAIEQYNQFSRKRKELAYEFEACYGPLQHFGMSYSRYPWSWDQTPWPWQV